MAQLSIYPILGIFISLVILVGRRIEDVVDPYEGCGIMCKAAAEYHNRQLMIEMKNLKSIVEDTAAALNFPIDQVPLFCTENPFSLLQRYQLRSLVESAKAENRIQHFNVFIKKIS